MEKQRLAFYNSPVEAVILIAVYLIATIVGAFILVPFAISKGLDPVALIGNGWFLLIATAFPMLVTLGVAFTKLDWRKVVQLRWNFSVPILLLSILSIYLTSLFIEEVLQFIPYYDRLIEWMEDMIQPSTGMLVAVVLFAPVFEEIFFRGIILRTFLAHYSVKKSILLSALIFGLIHVHPLQVFGAFAAGILLGWIYWRTRSLLLVIVLHAFNNGLASLTLFLGEGSLPASLKETLGNFWLWLIILLFIPVVLYFTILGIQKLTNSGPPPIPN